MRQIRATLEVAPVGKQLRVASYLTLGVHITEPLSNIALVYGMLCSLCVGALLQGEATPAQLLKMSTMYLP